MPSVLILPLSRDTAAVEGAQECANGATVGWEDVTVEQMRLEINVCMILGEKRRLNKGCHENAFLQTIFIRKKKSAYSRYLHLVKWESEVAFEKSD